MLSYKTSRAFLSKAAIIVLIAYSRRNKALDIILNLFNLYLSSRLKNNKYYKTRIRRRLSLLILMLLRVIYLKIDIAVK